MSDDLVFRLEREHISCVGPCCHNEELLQEAAQRIKELEQLVRECMESDSEFLTEWDLKARTVLEAQNDE